MKAEQLTFARLTGHEMAQRSADRAGEEWKVTAFRALETFARGRVLPFTIEDVRDGNRDLAQPPDSRAWGAIAMKARREGLIEPCGLAPTVSSRGGYRMKWRLRA